MKLFKLVYANDNTALIPELWANESLVILEENMVAANLINRDFNSTIAKFGDIVHTRKPGEFTAERKTDADSVVVQDATSTDIQVKLDQHWHTSFLIKDGEETKSFKELRDFYLGPALLSIAQQIDRVILGQFLQFRVNGAYGGGLGLLTSSTAKADILDTRNGLNKNKAWMSGRNLILTPDSETEILKLDLFTSADKIGDEGTALREASLGRKLGFNIFMAQNMASVGPVTATETAVGAIDLTAGYAKGATVLVVDTFSGTSLVGEFLTIAGDDTIHQISATSGSPTDSITLREGLRRSVVDDAVITTITATGAAVGAYAIGYAKKINVDGLVDIPQVGQACAFDITDTEVYTIVDVTEISGTEADIVLDRPLVVAIANDDTFNPGPVGNYNFAFHRNALTLVNRPLAMPAAGAGALSSVANFNDLSIRVTITYDGNKQGHLVTVDMLAGIKVLEENLGGILYG